MSAFWVAAGVAAGVIAWVLLILLGGAFIHFGNPSRDAEDEAAAMALASSLHKRPAAGEQATSPPGPASDAVPARPPPPGPGPRHRHGGCDITIRLYHCGCIHFYDRQGAITEAWPCSRDRVHDWDAFLREITP